MKVVIGSDHAGFSYKELLVKRLGEKGHEILDKGVFNTQPADYPDCAASVALALLNNEGERGILICGSSVGVSIAANKFRGIRAGVCHDTYSAHQGVEHDDVNILCLGERVVGIELVYDIVDAYLGAVFSHSPRHVNRLNKVAALEDKNMKEVV